VLFVVTLPPLLILLGAVAALTGRELWALVPILDKLTLEVLTMRIQTIIEAHIATIIGLQLILAPFTIGLFLGAAAYAYKELVANAPRSGSPNPVP
jgi:cytochrome bd-type quinol oxidase subunit 1